MHTRAPARALKALDGPDLARRPDLGPQARLDGPGLAGTACQGSQDGSRPVLDGSWVQGPAVHPFVTGPKRALSQKGAPQAPGPQELQSGPWAAAGRACSRLPGQQKLAWQARPFRHSRSQGPGMTEGSDPPKGGSEALGRPDPSVIPGHKGLE
eukprot:NODE_3077_length_984_cov_7.333690_g2569_i0.p1 GENE.NODE_3077_length_984_cov_7.333690_g2569_i0~~NODE_3077_length_984_cov_7.333690_g2569_i0.p1  ORF type:complete len:154 (-),score=3.43 NODE_3077_length_984_cov_7.333690_g2569_i0:121-582(-)